MTEHSQNNNNSNEGGQSNANNSGGDGDNSSTQNNQSQGQSSSNSIDIKNLSADQLQQVLTDPKVLENKALWDNPRIKQLLDSDKKLKEMQTKQEQESETKLKEEKKFEELVGQKDNKIGELQTQMDTLKQDQALTNLLVKEKVVDLDGALKLVNRSDITIKDDGSVEGADKAIESLKTDKAYLFNSNSQGGVGTPSNAGNQNQSQGTAKFKRSQLQGEAGTRFYNEHKKDVDEAYAKGLIEDDIS